MAMHQVRSRVLALAGKKAYAVAIALAADFARRNPDSAACQALVAQAEEIAGYTKAAIQSISRAIALAPQELAYRQTRARLYLAAHLPEEALREMECLIAVARSEADDAYVDAARACRDELLRRLKAAA